MTAPETKASERLFKEQQHVLDWMREIGVRIEYDSLANRYKFPTNDLYELLVGLQSLQFTRHPAPHVMGEDEAVDYAMQQITKHPVQSVREGVAIALRYAIAKNTPPDHFPADSDAAMANNKPHNKIIDNVVMGLDKRIEQMQADIMKAKEALQMISKVELGARLGPTDSSGQYYSSWDDGEYVVKVALAALEKYGEK